MALPEPSFITRDPKAITSEMIASYEATTGKVLQPAQVERLLIDLISYRESLIRIGIQEAAKQCLVEYAVYPMLDYLGELVGVTRLAAQASACEIRFHLTGAKLYNVSVPAGTRVESGGGGVVFETTDNLVIETGETYGDVSAVCQTAGVLGNGYAVGVVNSLLDVVEHIESVTNITETSGGSDQESDGAMRARVKLAPEQFTNAGSYGAYRYHAVSAHQDIVDVAVISPTPGTVNIYPLTKTGNPPQAILEAVQKATAAETVRPLCDAVQVLPPTRKDFALSAQVELYTWADGAAVQANIEAQLMAYVTELRATLGRDVVETQIIAVVNGVYGVYKTTLVSPSADVVNAENEWSNCTDITITVTGYNDG